MLWHWARRDCDLIRAEKIFEFLLRKLNVQESMMGHKLCDRTGEHQRIKERRNANLARLLCYLEDPSALQLTLGR